MRFASAAVAFSIAVLASSAGAQDRSQGVPTSSTGARIVLDRGPQAAEVTSPEVLPDRRVTFRIGAPNAKTVTLGSEFITQANAVQGPPGDMTAGPTPVVNMVKGADGVWTGTTTEPIRPGAYRYFFVVDGVVTLDPRNTQMSPQHASQNSLLLVPGDFSEHRKVPHGSVSEQHFVSSTLGGIERPIVVYTPPGYEKGGGRYPVLYLMHGNADSESSWVTAARAHDILDNLIAEGRAKPMILVMPAGYTPGANQVLTSDPAKEPFVREMMTDIIPFIDSHYRTIRSPDSRAMAGLSMGGVQTLNVALSNLGTFRYVGIFSSGWFNAANTQWWYEHRAPSEVPRLNRELKLFWWGWGYTDFARPTALEVTGFLKSKGVKLVTRESPGGHDWRNWRLYLYEFAPLLFR